MKRFLAIFSDSAKELTNLRCIVMTGMLIAVHVLLSIFVMIPIGENIKISFSFLALASIGMLFGPIPAAIAGGITDILGFMLANKTGGAYHPGFTLVQIERSTTSTGSCIAFFIQSRNRQIYDNKVCYFKDSCCFDL